MRRYTFATMLLAAAGLQAQVINVNNTDGTTLPLDTKAVSEITFDEAKKIVTLSMNEGERHSFHTDKVEDISKTGNKQEKLEYSLAPTVSFDSNDKKSYNEVTETIITDELIDESGDFVENFTVSYVIDIQFTENDVAVSGNTSVVTYTKDGAHLVITGTKGKTAYVVSGKSGNGSLKIYSPKKFQLVLCGLDLTNSAGPAINIQTGKTVYLTVEEGSTNSLCDGATYNAPVLSSDGITYEDQKGTLFSEGQLIFDGTGTLNVTSLGGHGICSDDYIRIRSGNINIKNAAKDGFHTNDKLMISRTAEHAPVINITAANDGIDCGKGEVIIDAGKTTIISGGEAIKAVYEATEPDPLIVPKATINGGYVEFTTTGDKSSGIKTNGEFVQNGGIVHGTVKGNGSKVINCDKSITFNNGKVTGFCEGTVLNDTTSAGGIKCEGNFTLNNGTIAMKCSGKGAKGLNCKIAMIKGGEVTLLSEAENFNGTEGDRKSVAVDADNLIVTGGRTALSAYSYAVSTTNANLSNGILHAISQNATAFKNGATQKGGWLMIKEAE